MQRALQLYFGQTPPPSVGHIGLQLGLSGKNTGTLQQLWSSCQSHEVSLAKEEQAAANLSGQMESDATSIRKWKEDRAIQYHQVFGVFRRPASFLDICQFCVYSMGRASSQKSGSVRREEANLGNRSIGPVQPRDSAHRQTVIPPKYVQTMVWGTNLATTAK